jgi:hypothetical protein
MKLILERKVGAGERTGAIVRKAVLIAMADRASDDGSGIWASQATLAATAECSERALRNALADLEEEGLIAREDDASQRTVTWRINVTALDALPVTRNRDA